MPEISIQAEQIFRIGHWPITNAFLLSFMVLLIFVICAAALRRKLTLIPGKLQSLFELFIEEALSLMDTVFGERRLSERYLPLVATIFLFILISNWIGLFPGIGSIKIGDTRTAPLFRSPASDLNFTIALAVISVVSVNLLGVLVVGFKKHFSKFFTLKHPISSFVGLLEFISEFIKIISFSFRLFGNVFAGEVLLTIVGFLVPYFIPLPFLFLEVFVGFIQAFIFSMLTLVFIAMATTEETAH
ncbi:MAG: F0F1 ATP synthase subunit A, partial [Candidatus Sungbacteria bacterium]|nr:F0F1 ATP synthase subunit A [Candidatus Sungbacteria bacterium]